jgi:insertion element IS1 protein InsB
MNAIMWYLSGMSMNRIACLSRVSVQSVLNWIRAFAKDHYEQPQPTGTIIVIELDEMWPYLKKKRQQLWLWKALDPESGQLLDWECGGRDKKTLKKMVDRLAQFNVQVYCTDKLATYFRPRWHLLSTFAYRQEMRNRFESWAAITGTEQAA